MSLIEEARAVRERIAARLQELEPLVREYEGLRRLAAELGLDSEELADSDPEPTQPPRPASRTTKRNPARRRAGGRREAKNAQAQPSGDGDDLGERVLKAVREQPGKTV